MTSLCLNHPLINSTGGTVHLVPVPNLRQITPHMVLPACFSNHHHLRSHHCARFPSVVYPLLLISTVFCIFTSPSPAPAQPRSLPLVPEKEMLKPCRDMEKSEMKRSWALKFPYRPAFTGAGLSEPVSRARGWAKLPFSVIRR